MSTDLSPSEAFGERLREARLSAGLSQAELSKRLEKLGVRLKRPAIIEIEKKARRVTLDEALAISAALGVAPINMMVPFEDERVLNEHAAELGIFEPVADLKVGEGLSLVPISARAWIRGDAIWPGAPVDDWNQYYCVQVPPGKRYRLRQLGSYVREHAKKLGRWTLPLEPEPLAGEAPPEMAVPGFTTPENARGFPAPLWTWLMFNREEEENDG